MFTVIITYLVDGIECEAIHRHIKSIYTDYHMTRLIDADTGESIDYYYVVKVKSKLVRYKNA